MLGMEERLFLETSIELSAYEIVAVKKQCYEVSDNVVILFVTEDCGFEMSHTLNKKAFSDLELDKEYSLKELGLCED